MIPLTKLAETSQTITVGWAPVPGAIGYRFSFEHNPKPSHTWDVAFRRDTAFPACNTRISKAAGKLTLDALSVRDVGVYPPSPLPVVDKLLYRPPTGWENFERVDLMGSDWREFPDDRAILLNIGDYVYEEGIALIGGRRVVIMGGRSTAAGLSRAAGVGLAVWPRTAESQYHVEGIRIQPIRNADGSWKRTLNDGIAIRGPKGMVTIQNCLVGPCAVKQGYTSAQVHPDIVQIQGDFDGELRVHRFTGYTEYTGVMESAMLVRKQHWDHVNLVATGFLGDDLDPLDIDPATRGHTAFGIYDDGLTKTLPGLTMNEFYWAKDPLQGFAGFSPPELGQRAKSGKPAGGDFVTEADVGPEYVSPGYV